MLNFILAIVGACTGLVCAFLSWLLWDEKKQQSTKENKTCNTLSVQEDLNELLPGQKNEDCQQNGPSTSKEQYFESKGVEGDDPSRSREVSGSLQANPDRMRRTISVKSKAGHTVQIQEERFAGKWEMESEENYGDYLQFVCKLPGFIMKRIAGQKYKQTFTFEGRIVGISIEGLKTSHTDFEIGAEPIEIDMQGRKFHDVIGWSEDEEALVIERNSVDGQVKILIVRHIGEDGKMVQETFCTGTDGTNITATQIFKRIE